MKLLDGLYTYVWQGMGNNANSYALRYDLNGAARYAIIDPGHRVVPYGEPGLDALLRQMKQDGIEPGQVGLVVNTHAHPDHCESSLPLRRASGARVALHRDDLTFYEKLMAAVYRGDNPKPDELRPDVFLKEGVLNLGQPPGVALEVVHTPGHSPGSISLWWAEGKVLFTGDTVFYRSVGRTDIPGGSTPQLAKSVRKLSELKPEYVLTGHAYGHPGVIKGAEEVARNFEFIISRVLPFC